MQECQVHLLIALNNSPSIILNFITPKITGVKMR